jgi:hypothetical protein
MANNLKNLRFNTSASSNNSSLIKCLFSHINTDPFESVEFLLQEMLFKFVQNGSFNKSEKIRVFNERTLTQLIKLFEWKDHRNTKMSDLDGAKRIDQTLVVRKMITEFLKVLFGSTKHGISFYDRSLNVDQSTKNLNHLIFNALIGIQRPSYVLAANELKQMKDVNDKTNEMIDELFLKSLKV